MKTRTPAGQLTLDLPVRTALEREDFLVAPANEAAVAAVERWPDWDHPVLVIVGPQASGKSHLAKVWQHLSGALQLGSGELTPSLVVDAMQTSALLIEDAPGDTLDETALFHAVNLAREKRRTILMTSTADPAQWHVELADLRSRLRAARVARLGPPDDALLRAVLVKQFTDRQITVDEPAIAYMLTRMERSFEAARRLVLECDRRSLAEKVPITRSFVAKILADSAGK